MKAIKYLLMGALMTAFSGSAMAQTEVKDAVNAIKTNKDKAAVANIVKAVVKENKKDAKALAAIGRAYLDVKDTANAHKYGDMSVALTNKMKTGKVGDGFILLGDLAYNNDDPGMASSWYEQAYYADPNNINAYVKYARVMRGVSPDMAVEQLEKVRQIDPNYPVDAEAGHIYYEAATNKNKKYMKKVLEYYGRLTPAKLYEFNSKYFYENVITAYLSEELGKSKELAEFGLTKNTDNKGYTRIAMISSYKLKEYEEAAKYCKILFSESDSTKYTSEDYRYAGLICYELKDYDNAIMYYNKQLAIETNDVNKANVLKNLSEAYKSKGEYTKSLELYENYLKINPNVNATDYNGLATIYRNQAASQKGIEQTESVNKAVSIYNEMAEKYPKYADYCMFIAARTLGMIDPTTEKGLAKPYYDKLAKIIEAKSSLEEIDKTRLSEAYRYLGAYYYNIKNEKATAKPYFEKLLKLDPNNEVAKQALATY